MYLPSPLVNTRTRQNTNYTLRKKIEISKAALSAGVNSVNLSRIAGRPAHAAEPYLSDAVSFDPYKESPC